MEKTKAKMKIMKRTRPTEATANPVISPAGKHAPTVPGKTRKYTITWRWRWSKDEQVEMLVEATTAERANNKFRKRLVDEYAVSNPDVVILYTERFGSV